MFSIFAARTISCSPSIFDRFRVVQCICLVCNDYSNCYEVKPIIIG